MTLPAYELNGQPVARENFYAIACDPRRSVAVEACAGAGKTWMLVSRMLRALLEGAAPHEILAITFTKKAAGEMRQRLSEWLDQFARAPLDQLVEELRLRGLDVAQARTLAPALQGLYARLLAAGRPVQIRTFHSWFAALLRNAPLAVLESLGLPANYELLEDDARAVDLVWRRFHAALLARPEARLDYAAQVRVYGRYQTERALEAALARRVEFALADAQGRVADSVPHFRACFPDCDGVDEPLQLLVSPGPLREQLVQAAQSLGRASQPTFSAKGSELERALTNLDAAGVVDALMTQAGTPRKFGDKVAGIDQVRAVQEAVLRVQVAQLQHQAWEHQQRMARLTRLLIAEFAALKREHGWIDMNDVEQAALHLLADPVLGGWVQQRLDARVRHLLIDEFQDTNPLQWQALHAWLSGYAGAGGGGEAPSLFIVGDPKQSIYRFRRAEPQVFKAAQSFVYELGGDLLSCDHTRRNAPAVLELVNTAMAQAQQEGNYEGFRAHSTESRDEGAALHLLPIVRPEKTKNSDAEPVWRDSLTTPRETPEETLRALECRQAAHWLAGQLGAGVPPKEIMVLARKRDRLSVMQDELRALGVAAVQPEKSELGEAPEVQDLVALLDALISPAHDLSLARALRSPLFGVSDDDLIALALRQREANRTWFDLLGADTTLPVALQEAGRRLMCWQTLLATLPPHDALDTIYREGDVLARFAAAAPAALRASVLANLQALLAAALQIDGGRYATPYALVRALKAGGIPAPGLAVADAVRLLTVHGAKGLEARVVLLLDTDAPPPKAQTMGVLVDWPGQDSAPRHFIFLASESKAPPSVVDVLATEQQARQREELNALYVAMTRARRQLVLSSVQPYRGEGANGRTWWQRLQPGCQALGAVPAVAPVVNDASEILLAVLPAAHVSRVAAESPAESSPASVASRIGQAMHRLLEWSPLGVRACADALVRRAASEFDLDGTQAERAARMAERILTGDGAWAWDGARINWHGNEVSIAVQGGLRRIDRLVRTCDGTWWVLDYKSTSEPQAREELLAQLRAYRAAVQAAYPGETVRAAFLSGQGTVEEIA